MPVARRRLCGLDIAGCPPPMVSVPWYRYKVTFPHRCGLVRMVFISKIKHLALGDALVQKSADLGRLLALYRLTKRLAASAGRIEDADGRGSGGELARTPGRRATAPRWRCSTHPPACTATRLHRHRPQSSCAASRVTTKSLAPPARRSNAAFARPAAMPQASLQARTRGLQRRGKARDWPALAPPT